jgi:hypothetical protein
MDAASEAACQMVAAAGHNSLILFDRQSVSSVPWHTERRGSVRRPTVPAGRRHLPHRQLRALFAFDALNLSWVAKDLVVRAHLRYLAARVGQDADSRRPAGSGDRGFVLLDFAGRTRVAGAWTGGLLLVAGLVALVQFHRTGGIGALALGWFCLGLGMWDKALFAWTLGGVAVAGGFVFHRELWKRLTWRNAAVASLLR